MSRKPGSGFEKISRRDFAKGLGVSAFGLFAFKLFQPEVFATTEKSLRLLTQEHLTAAATCPTKLFYIGKEAYANQTLDDPFMEALGEGGFQVSALAKFYHPDGRDIPSSLSLDERIERTRSALGSNDHSTLFGGSIRYKNLSVEPDILILKGKKLTFIDVKAKVFDSRRQPPFLTRRRRIRKSWKPILFDVAFQKYVIQKAFPAFEVEAVIMMADKSKEAPTQGLNQKFRISKGRDGSKSVIRSLSLSDEDRKTEILSKINVDKICTQIFSEPIEVRGKEFSFEKMVEHFSKHVVEDKRIKAEPEPHCRDCEFRSKSEESKDGFKECWSEALGWKEKDFSEPNILNIWDFRRKPALIKAGRIKQKQVKKSDIKPKSDNRSGLSRTERQWLQVSKVKKNDGNAFIDKEGLKREMDSFVYPLHFIDFETSAPAIPFTKGMRPYEGIAFQFSHHVIYKDGRVEHKGEWLNAEPGEFPNFKFVRALKTELEGDKGSIFRYSSHENTYLNFIYRQLGSDFHKEDDADELRAFIRSITQSPGRSSESWFGERNMIDQLRLVKRYYYDPFTNGSNSIKKVLPAILNSSEYLQSKYSKPVYGSDRIPSKNFTNWQWIEKQNGKIVDPYQRLPKLFQGASEKDLQLLSNDNTLGDGGAALTAYGRLQFEEMSDYERSELKKGLLKYCELDTFAMVMIHEGWREMLK